MGQRVYEVRDIDRQRLAGDLAEDRISRLSIAVRDARHFGLDRDGVFVVLEGDDEVLLSADERILVYGRVPEEAEKVLAWVKWEDEAAAYGVGRVFGPVEVAEAPPRVRAPWWLRAWRWMRD